MMTVSVKVNCSSCGRSYKVDEAKLGRSVNCQECGESFVLATNVAAPIAPPPLPNRPAPASKPPGGFLARMKAKAGEAIEAAQERAAARTNAKIVSGPFETEQNVAAFLAVDGTEFTISTMAGNVEIFRVGLNSITALESIGTKQLRVRFADTEPLVVSKMMGHGLEGVAEKILSWMRDAGVLTIQEFENRKKLVIDAIARSREEQQLLRDAERAEQKARQNAERAKQDALNAERDKLAATRLEEIKTQIGNIEGVGEIICTEEVKELPSILWEDERVERFVTGKYSDNLGILVATNKRLVFVAKGVFSGMKVEDFPYNRISSVQYETGWVTGKLTIFAAGNRAVIERVLNPRVRDLAVYVQAKIAKAQERAASPPQAQSSGETDVVSQIERLAKLKEQGLLTEEEFTAKKTKLLDRI